MAKPFEEPVKKEQMSASEFNEKTTKLMDEVLAVNMKDPEFDLKNEKDKEFYEGILGARKMVADRLYKEPKFFAGEDGLRQPKPFETPEGFLKWQLQRHEETIAEMKQRYPDTWRDFIPKTAIEESEEIKGLLKFIESEGADKSEEKNQKREDAQPREEQTREKLEGEALFGSQIENNSHPSAKNLKEDLALFVKSIDIMRTNFQATKEELSEILYRNDLEYVENEDIKIDEEDKQIFQPILDFRKELDKWNTLTEPKIADFRQRLLGYMRDTFGIETQEPKEGEKYDSKNMQAVKVEKTKNEFLDYKIKKIFSPGFKINGELFDYYIKWYKEKEQEMKDRWNSLKDKVSEQELDKQIEEDRLWLKKHLFTQSIRPPRVEIYRFEE